MRIRNEVNKGTVKGLIAGNLTLLTVMGVSNATGMALVKVGFVLYDKCSE